MNQDTNPTMDDLYFLFRKKWTLCVLLDLHMGNKHFQDFYNNIPGLSTKVLNQTLSELEHFGLISKKIIQEKPKITEYHLTENGKLSKKFIKEYFSFLSCVSSDSMEHKEILEKIDEL